MAPPVPGGLSNPIGHLLALQLPVEDGVPRCRPPTLRTPRYAQRATHDVAHVPNIGASATTVKENLTLSGAQETRYAVRHMLALAIRAFLTLFVLLDPIGLAPLFLGLAGNRSTAERARIAKRAVLVAGGVLLVFAIAGSWLLTNLGISLGAFRVAGGVLLFRIAVDMVFAQLERETPEEASEARVRPEITVFPLAIPLIAGPGALACIMILAGEAHAFTWGLPMVLGVCVVDLALVLAGLHVAVRIAHLLGQTGINVVSRVLGVLLAALAVQYVADGVRGLLATR